MKTPFYQVDVFTNHMFGGNPLAVFVKGEIFKQEELQKVALEMNLSETTFVYPPSLINVDFDVRVFTPKREIPFAGHPTLGTAYVLRKYCGVTANPLRLNFKKGVISVWIEGDKFFMEHPPSDILYELNRSENIAAALGLTFTDLCEKLPIRVVSTGFPALLVPITSLDIINKISINTQVLNHILGPLGVDMIYPFCRKTLDPDNTVHVRAFAPNIGISEDPATGSVAGAMGAYWASINPEDKIKMVIEQGYAMHRPSLIYVEVSENQKILVGGQCHPVFTGNMTLKRNL